MGADLHRSGQPDAASGVDPRCVECIDAKGATHVHLHVNSDRGHRLAEKKDLLDNFPQACIPDGCNQKQSN
jgi:hypothetical protein